MNTKKRILEALDCALDDISEERLLDILLDAYHSKKKEIERLQGENSHEREMLHSEREQCLEDRRRMLRDPLYGATAQYYFLVNGHRIGVTVIGSRIDVFERQKNIDFSAQQITFEDFGR